jgi:hypothetical protein
MSCWCFTSAGPRKKPTARPRALATLATAVAVLRSLSGNQSKER